MDFCKYKNMEWNNKKKKPNWRHHDPKFVHIWFGFGWLLIYGLKSTYRLNNVISSDMNIYMKNGPQYLK